MPDDTPQLEWLVIALVYNHQYYDELYYATFPEDDKYKSMEDQKNHLFHAFHDIPFSGRVKKLVVENRLQFKGDIASFTLSNTVTVSQKTDKEDRLVPYPIEPIMEHQETLTDGKVMGAFLQKLVSAEKAKRNLVITFGHGAVLGINLAMQFTSFQALLALPAKPIPKAGSDKKNEVEEIPVILRDKEISLTNNKAQFKLAEFLAETDGGKKAKDIKKKFFTKEEFDELAKKAQAFTMLTNAELNIALQQAMADEFYPGDETPGNVQRKPLNILVMFNCLMQNLYTQYELRNTVSYLVAPESGICYPGYNYRGVFAALQSHPEMPDEEVVNLFTDTIRNETATIFHEKYYTKYKSDIEGTWKITGVKIERAQLEAINSKFDELIKKIIELSKTSIYVFINIRDTLTQCFNYTFHCVGNNEKVIDLLVFCNRFIRNVERPTSSIKSLAEPVRELANSLAGMRVCSVFEGTDFFTDESFADMNDTQSHKFSFGFLMQTEKYPLFTIERATLGNPASDCYPEFLKDTSFDEFYKSYLLFNGSE